MRSEFVKRSPLFGLNRARSIIAAWVTADNAAKPDLGFGYETPTAYAVVLATADDLFHKTKAFRRSSIAPSAEAGNYYDKASAA